MLTLMTGEPLTAEERGSAYRCWAAAYPLHEMRAIQFGSHGAASPRLALRWLRERARHVTDQLDTAYAQPGHYWLTDEAEHERALAYLTTARPTNSRFTTRTPATCSWPAHREAPRERTPPRLLVRMLDPEPQHGPTTCTACLLRRLLSRPGRPVDRHRATHHQPSTRHRSLRASVGVALRGPCRHQTGPAPSGTLLSHRAPGRYTHHVDGPPGHLPTARRPPEHRTSSLRIRFQAPRDRLSYNFLYSFKARAQRGRAHAG